MTANRPLDIVTRFLSLVNRNLIDEAMDLLADDVFYHNVPLAPIVGRENVRAFTHAFGMGTRLRPEWELLAIASVGDTVLTERVDRFVTEDNHRLAIPLMGSFRVHDGLIGTWRDYFDLQDLERQLAAAGMSIEG